MTLRLHGRINGPIVMIGFGSIGRGTLPLMLRHFDCDRSKITIIDPDDRERRLAEQEGIRFETSSVTRENYRDQPDRNGVDELGVLWPNEAGLIYGSRTPDPQGAVVISR